MVALFPWIYNILWVGCHWPAFSQYFDGISLLYRFTACARVCVCTDTNARRNVAIRWRAGRFEESAASVGGWNGTTTVHYTGAPRVSCSRRSAYGYRSPLRELIGFGVELLIRLACIHIQAVPSHVYSRTRGFAGSYLESPLVLW